MNIGSRIKKMRKQQNRTLQEIADICGFTRSLLSKIENSKTIPPIATLSRIAKALGVKVATLLDDDSNVNGIIYTPGKDVSLDNMVGTDKGYLFFPFASERGNKLFQPYLFTAERDKVITQPLSHEGEEFIYVLEGEMRYRIGSVEYTMRPGDSLYFNSIDEHDLRPITDKVVYLAVFCLPE